MAATLYLIRHGETLWSRNGQHTGLTDLPLTAQGEEQARALQEVLQGIDFAQVLVSPLQRARRTCELAGLAPLARVVPELREWEYGQYEGMTGAQIRLQRPGWDVFTDGCPGGESVAQLQARVDGLRAALAGQQGRIALFAHGHLLRAFAARWLGAPLTLGRQLLLDAGHIGRLGFETEAAATPTLSLWNAIRL